MDGTKIVRLALELVLARILTCIALMMAFALACWAMSDPVWERMAMAGFFAIFVFIPCLLKEAKDHEGSKG